jgi:hypothetical protein
MPVLVYPPSFKKKKKKIPSYPILRKINELFF